MEATSDGAASADTATVQLTALEVELRDAIGSGALVGPEGDSADGDSWGGERTVSGSFLYQLATGSVGGQAQPRALRLQGVKISGGLAFWACEIGCPLYFKDCYFVDPLDLREARIASLRLRGCRLSGLFGDQLETRGDLDLTGSVVTTDGIHLNGARVGNHLILRGTTITNRGRSALSLAGCRIEQSVICDKGFKAEGEACLLGTQIGSQLNLDGATLQNPDGFALSGDGLEVGQTVNCGLGFKAEGEVRLNGARVGGQVNFSGATLDNANGLALNADGLEVNHQMLCDAGFTARGGISMSSARVAVLVFKDATLTNSGAPALAADRLTVHQSMHCSDGFTAQGEVRLLGAEVGGQLNFRGATLKNPGHLALDLERLRASYLLLTFDEPPEGRIDLRHARVGHLSDDPAVWPQTIEMRGFAYESLDDNVGVNERLAWIDKAIGGYQPQAYDQLLGFYRRSGRDEDAKTVAIAKQRRRRAQLRGPARAWSLFLDWTVAYGFATWRAVYGLLAVMTIGWVVFASASWGGLERTKPEDQLPQFEPWLYSIDSVLPVINLGQEGAWAPTGLALYWYAFSILSGWILGTALIAALTAMLTRD